MSKGSDGSNQMVHFVFSNPKISLFSHPLDGIRTSHRQLAPMTLDLGGHVFREFSYIPRSKRRGFSWNSARAAEGDAHKLYGKRGRKNP